VKRMAELSLGVLTAIGAFVDIGDIVASAETGARFGMGLAWAILLGTFGICLFAEMAGRIAAMSKRATFDLIRERMGPRIGLVALGSAFFINFLTLAAELGGLALVVQLLTNQSHLFFVIPLALMVGIVTWRVKFTIMEKVVSLFGLALLVSVVALWKAGPDWSSLWHSASHPVVPNTETHALYWYWAISIVGATITVYEPFFFSSGAIEEKWGREDLVVNRTNVYLGFPLGALISLAIMGLGAIFLFPAGISPEHLSQTGMPVSIVLGRWGQAFFLLGSAAAFYAAALETSLSAGYIVCQYFGWPWGKLVKPKEAPRFHLIVFLTLIGATILVQTSVDPIKLTELTIALVAVVGPLTYFPILVLANDERYVGTRVNSRLSNALATIFMLVIILAAVAAIPLLIITKGGST
jgi:manganese transport protein